MGALFPIASTADLPFLLGTRSIPFDLAQGRSGIFPKRDRAFLIVGNPRGWVGWCIVLAKKHIKLEKFRN